jgi:hypothetical protein
MRFPMLIPVSSPTATTGIHTNPPPRAQKQAFAAARDDYTGEETGELNTK